MKEDSQQFFQEFSENDPKQLRQVIELLITKSRVLIQNLEETWEKLEQTQTEKTFWKQNYFSLKEACHQYVECNGLTPFNYIAALQDQLKKQKVYKSCLEEKFKVMHPQSVNHPKIMIENISESKRAASLVEKGDRFRKTISSTLMKQSYGENQEGRLHNRNKIGPKNIEFFKFREQKQ